MRRLRFVIGWDPPAADHAQVNAGTGHRKKTGRRKRRNVCSKLFEEDAVEENGKFRPVESVHFQIGDGRGYKGTSRIGTFKRNGSSGDEMISHLHFLKYAWYFVHGAKLPDDIKQQFLTTANDPWVDLSTMKKEASRLFREAARKGHLSRRDVDSVHEEFHKLALDCGSDDYTAVVVREHTMRARLSVRKEMGC